MSHQSMHKKCSSLQFSRMALLISLACQSVFIAAEPIELEHISKNAAGIGGNNGSDWPSVSADGRYIAFASTANNLVPTDKKNDGDIFVLDRQTSVMTLVTVPPNGGSSALSSGYLPWISENGRYVVFVAPVDNLVPDDQNQNPDVYVFDRQTKVTERASAAKDGNPLGGGGGGEPHISANGRFVVFQSGHNDLVEGDQNGKVDVFIHDRQSETTQLVSVSSNGEQGNESSYNPRISGNGRYVTFTSAASNLVPNDNNGLIDAFVHDLQTHQTELISVAVDGGSGNEHTYDTPHINFDGRYVVFASRASNLVVGDNNFIVFPSDPTVLSSVGDIFIRDRQHGTTELISLTSNGLQAKRSSQHPFISADGRYVAFRSQAYNLVPGDTNRQTDAFVYDRLTKIPTLISKAADGTAADKFSLFPRLSADGCTIAFMSDSEHLVPNDTNRDPDVFLRPDAICGKSSIRVVLDTVPNNRRNFSFTSDFGNFALDDVSPQDTDSITNTQGYTLKPGSYTINQTLFPTLYNLSDIDCGQNAQTSVNLAQGSVTVTLQPGQHVQCKFTNNRIKTPVLTQKAQ